MTFLSVMPEPRQSGRLRNDFTFRRAKFCHIRATKNKNKLNPLASSDLEIMYPHIHIFLLNHQRFNISTCFFHGLRNLFS